MVRTVYADLLFLINFSMDFLCFFLVSRLFSRSLSIGRTVAASALGGVYAVLSLFFSFRGLFLLFCDFLACALMCLVAEMRRGMRWFLLFREILVYTGVSMALGGIMTAAYSILNEAGIPESLSGESDGLPAWLFLLLAVIGGGATLLGSRFFRRNATVNRYLVTVMLCGRVYTFRAQVDTGNCLADPISGCSAAAVDHAAAAKLLSDVDEALLLRPTDCIASLPEKYRSRARLLPAETVTGGGMLLAFRPDSCYIRPEGADEKDAEARTLMIAVAPVHMEDAEMLLPPGIF